MTADGFFVAGCDGSIPQGGIWNSLPAPPEIAGVRPDAYGVAPTTGDLAFGEAKTVQDIDTSHTQTQLRVLGRLVDRDKRVCRLYVAVPRSAAVVLRITRDLGVPMDPRIADELKASLGRGVYCGFDEYFGH